MKIGERTANKRSGSVEILVCPAAKPLSGFRLDVL